MLAQRLKPHLQAGGTAFGTFLFEFATPGIARIVAAAGADFVLFDMEHTGWSLETIKTLIATSRSTDLTTLVRIPATEYHFIARVLDMGAGGLMAPMVESAEQARRLVQSAKYPPVGRRGAAFSIAHDDYTGGDIVAKIAAANRDTLLIAQIETAAGLASVDEIAAVDGIDVLWIGQFDLSNSLGIPGQFEHPKFVAGVARVLEACKQHGKIPGFMVGDVAWGQRLLNQGYRMIAYSGDCWILQAALASGLTALREHRPASSK